MAIELRIASDYDSMNMTMTSVPDIRVRSCNSLPVREDGEFVLYWMIASRRTAWNYAMDRVVEWAQNLRKPIIVLEALRCGYQWASDRMHSFLLDGMAENACRLEGTGVLHYPYLESESNAGKGLLHAMAAYACVVVTDEFPCYFIPQMVASAGQQVPIRMEAVDSNGIFPLQAADQAFSTAYAFRRFLQKNLPLHLMEFPKPDAIAKGVFPAAKEIPREIAARWPRATAKMLNGERSFLTDMPINHKIHPVMASGGATAAQTLLKGFLRNKLDIYLEQRNDPEQDATSGLSPYLHFGHISAHQIFCEVTRQEGWSPQNLALRATGSRTGWWGVSQTAEAFLDQLITWRELGFNFCYHRKDFDKFGSLPEWALKTLREHAGDKRSNVYTLEEFECASTHDPLWNAAQRQLVQEGYIHNYLRMLWGKKILEWTKSPARALEIMVEVNNKYALDGRDPNSYSGIFWCLGRYDRPWGPERPIFGTIRYMSSTNTARKLNVEKYLRRYGLNQRNRQRKGRQRFQRTAKR